MDLPQEVLFCLFSKLDPLKDFGICRLVSKSWLQMSRENQLWRLICVNKWRNNPNNSQVPNNSLIPVFEGTSVIDWKMVHELRIVSDSAFDSISSLASNTGAPLPSLENECFSQGWITFELFKSLVEKISLRVGNYPGSFFQICCFLVRFERLMLQQLDSTLLNEISFVGPFLLKYGQLMLFHKEAHLMIVADTREYRKITLKRKIPLKIVGRNIYLRGVFLHEYLKRSYPKDQKVPSTTFREIEIERHTKILKNFLETVILFIDDWVKSDLFEKWISEDSSEEQCPIHYLVETLESFSDLPQIEKVGFRHLFEQTEGLSQVTRIYMTAAAAAENFQALLKNISVNTFFETNYPWLLESPVNNSIELLVPTFETLPTIFEGLRSNLKIEDLDDPNIELSRRNSVLEELKFLQTLLSPILYAMDTDHARLRFMVTRCLGGFRQMFSESLFEPMLTPLLDRLLLFLRDKSLNIRLKATSGIGLLFLSSPASVPKHKGSVLDAFNYIVANGSAIEQDQVATVICQIYACDISEEFTTPLKTLYNNLISRFKNDQSANENQVLFMTEYAIHAFQEEFIEHLPIVFPVLYEHRAIYIDKTRSSTPNNLQYKKRRGSLFGAARLLQALDRDVLLPYYEQIGDIISNNFSSLNHQDFLEMSILCLDDYVKKFFTLETTQEAKWIARMFDLVESRLQSYAVLMFVESLPVIMKVMPHFTAILSYLCTINPLVHPLHNDQHMKLAVDVLKAFLGIRNLRGSATLRDEIEMAGVNYFQLLLNNTLNIDTFYFNYWMPILGAEIIRYHNSKKPPMFQDIFMIYEMLSRCGSRFTDPISRQFIDIVFGCRDFQNSKRMKNFVLNCTLLIAAKYPMLLPSDLTPTITWLEGILSVNAALNKTALAGYTALLFRQLQRDRNEKSVSDITSALLTKAMPRVITLQYEKDVTSIKPQIVQILNDTLPRKEKPKKCT